MGSAATASTSGCRGRARRCSSTSWGTDVTDAFDWGLLEPAAADGMAASDDRVLDAMVAFESAHLEVWSELLGVAVRTTLDPSRIDKDELLAATRLAGVPVVGLVQALRAQVWKSSGLVHQGLTSQDVVDSALMTVSREALSSARGNLAAAAQTLVALSREHARTPLMARTLMQDAEPTTLGAVFASWLDGVVSAMEA